MDAIYFKAEGSPLDGILGCFQRDQQKLNLAWLVEPRLDMEGLDCLAVNPIAASIHKYMDKITRDALRQPPLEFMRYWRSIDDGECALAEGWPDGYVFLMESRAKAWHRAQTVESEIGNVIKVNFRRTG